MDYEIIIAERVRQLRELNAIEQKELAAALAISNTALNNYENGVRKFPVSLIPKIADYFGVTIDYLYGRSDK